MTDAEQVLCGLNLAKLSGSEHACRLAARWQWPARMSCNAVFEVKLYQMPVRAHRQGLGEFEGVPGLPLMILTVEKWRSEASKWRQNQAYSRMKAFFE